MRYKDFSKNSYKASRNRNGERKNNPSSRWLKSAAVVAGLAVLIFGLKMMLTPVVGAMASFFQESSTAVSYMLNKDSIKKDNGVTNILLVGVDARETVVTGALTDTLIIASYHHETQKVSLLSLPRDLWINEQGSKINALYSTGNIELLKSVLEQKLGTPIHYYAVIDFRGFEKAVDAVGGIELYVERGFDDYTYPRPGYENATWNERWQHVGFTAGWQTMDGKTALTYARSRHALGPEGSDFARAKRQQKVILAAKDKILASETLFSLDKLRNLYLTMEDEVQTDIGLGELPLFYQIAKKIGEGGPGVETYVLQAGGDSSGNLLYNPDPADYGGAYVLVPQTGWQEIRDFVQQTIYGDVAGAQSTVSPTHQP